MRNLLLVILIVFQHVAILAQGSTWSLTDCVEYAKKNNISIKKQNNLLNQSKSNYNYSKLNFLPTLNAGIVQNFNFGKSISPEDNSYTDLNTSSSDFALSMSIPITEQLTNYQQLEINKLDFKASLLELDQIKEDLTINVTSAFLSVLYKQELIKLTRMQVTLSKELFDKTAEMKRMEVCSSVEVSNAKSQYAQDQYNLVQVENEYQQTVLDLTQLLNLPVPNNFQIDLADSIITDINANILTLDDIYNLAVDQRPGIVAGKYRLQQQMKMISVAKMKLIPTLSLQLGLNTGYYNIAGAESNLFSQQWGNNMNKNITFILSIPLFNHLEVIKNIKESRFQMINQEISLENAKVSLYKELQNIYLKITASKKKIESCKLLVEYADEFYKQVYGKYIIGKATTHEYNEAKTNLAKSQIQQIQALYENKFNKLILKYYLPIVR